MNCRRFHVKAEAQCSGNVSRKAVFCPCKHLRALRAGRPRPVWMVGGDVETSMIAAAQGRFPAFPTEMDALRRRGEPGHNLARRQKITNNYPFLLPTRNYC